MYRRLKTIGRYLMNDIDSNNLQFIEEISTLHRQVEILKKEVELKSFLLDNISDSIYLMDLDGNVIYGNNAEFETRGFSKNETPSLKQSAATKQILKYGAELKNETIFETIALKKDGNVIPVEIHTRIVEINKNMMVLSAARDITESKKLQKNIIAIVGSLTIIGKLLGIYSAKHPEIVARIASTIAAEMGYSEERKDGIHVMGLLHDIGNVMVPREILCNPLTLNELQIKIIQTHPQAGYEILKNIEFSCPVATAILQHHEHIDGSGYPQGLSDGRIIPEAKILAVAEVIETITLDQPYRPALGIGATIEEIEKNRGILYDTDVSNVCLKLLKEKRLNFL